MPFHKASHGDSSHSQAHTKDWLCLCVCALSMIGSQRNIQPASHLSPKQLHWPRQLPHLPDTNFQRPPTPIRAARRCLYLVQLLIPWSSSFFLCAPRLHTPGPHSAASPTGPGLRWRLAEQPGSRRGQRVGLVLPLKAWHSLQLGRRMGQRGPSVGCQCLVQLLALNRRSVFAIGEGKRNCAKERKTEKRK